MVDAVATQDETTRRAALGREVRLLVADDDERVRALYVTLLGDVDGVGSVVAAADGAEAVQLARAVELDVAVLDLQMPRLDGLAAALELGALQPTLAIALQSSDLQSLRRRARAAGYPLFDKADLDGLVAWVAGEVASLRRPARALRGGDVGARSAGARSGPAPMAERRGRADPVATTTEEGDMRGTLVCAVTDGDETDAALALGAELSDRLGLRLVLAHAVDGIEAMDDGDGGESVTMQAGRRGAERRLAQVADEHGVADRAERRVAVGEPAALLGQIAAEEAADVIVVGARVRGWRRRLDSRLADELETETAVPVLIAPPRSRRVRGQPPTNGGRR